MVKAEQRTSNPSAPDTEAAVDDLLRRGLEQSPEGTALLDPEGRILFANAAFQTLAPVAAADRGPGAASLARVPWFHHPWNEARNQGFFDAPVRPSGPDSGSEPFHLTLSIIHNDENQPAGWLVRTRRPARQPSAPDCVSTQNQYQLLFDQNMAGVYRSTLGGRLIECNQTLVQILGYESRQEIMSRPVTEFYDRPGDRTRLLDQIHQAQQVTGWEIRMKRKDVRVIHVALNMRLVDDPFLGEPVIQGTLMDISARVQAEETLRRSEERYRLLADNISDTIWTLDPATLAFTYCSPYAEQMVGFTPEEVMSLPFDQVMTPASVERAALMLAEEIPRFERGDVDPSHAVTVELELYRKDGSTVWAEVKTRPILDEMGRVREILGVSRDITARRKAEETLRLERERFRVLVEESPLGVALIGPDGGRYEYVNPRFTQIFGYRFSEIPNGREWFRRAFPDPEIRRRLIATWKKDLEDAPRGQSRPRTLEVACRDGTFKAIHFRPVALEDGRQLVTYEDVTERTRMEQALVQTEKLATIGRLAAGVAHEINNPLAGILQGTQMLTRRLNPADPKTKALARARGLDDDIMERWNQYLAEAKVPEFLQGIVDAGRRAARIVSNLMDFTGQASILITPHDLNEVVHRALALALTPTGPSQSRPGVELLVEKYFDPDLGEVPCDGALIQQVVLSLVRNSIQACAEGTRPPGARPVIRVRTLRLDTQAEVSVSDNGPGVPLEIRSRLFDPFFTTRSAEHAPGLGLYTSFGIIRRHDGALEHRAEEDGRTCFVFHLPLKTDPSLS